MSDASRRDVPVDEAAGPLDEEPPPPAPGPAEEPLSAPGPVEELPGPVEEPPPRSPLAAVRLGALGLALVLALSIGMARLFVGGPPSVEELRAQAGVENWPVLKIGVKDDQPGTALFRDGIWRGFDIDIAYMIAEDLGFRRSEVEFYEIESEDRARMQATDGYNRRTPVQMVIASFSITAEREQMAGVTFSAPYLYTEQSVLTLMGHEKVSALADLKGRNVCTLSTATSEDAPRLAGAIVSSRNQINECVDELRAHSVDAISTDAAILAGFKYQFPTEFEHWDLGLDKTEAWGINVGENPALKKLVDLTLYRSLKDPADDRWESAYDANLRIEEPANGAAPIAVAEQPDVPKPDVREQPWERMIP